MSTTPCSTTIASVPISQITSITISSVVPPLNPILEEMARTYCGHPALFIEPGVRTGMPVRFQVAEGSVQFNSVLVDIDEQTGWARSIERIDREVQ